MLIAQRLLTRTAALLAALVGVAMLTVSVAPAGNAASAFRFWGYHQLSDGAWAFSQEGADQTTPENGTVEGWRFALAGPSDTRAPRGIVTFEEVCKGSKPKAGNKQVAVVIDFGRPADAESGTPPKPATACAETPKDATGAQVLATAVGNKVRVENKMTCGILDWPAKGCGGEVKDVPAAAKEPDKTIEITRHLGLSTGGPATESAASSTAPDAAGADTSSADPSAAAADQASGSEDEEGPGALQVLGPVVLLLAAAGAVILAVVRRKKTESA